MHRCLSRLELRSLCPRNRNLLHRTVFNAGARRVVRRAMSLNDMFLTSAIAGGAVLIEIGTFVVLGLI